MLIDKIDHFITLVLNITVAHRNTTVAETSTTKIVVKTKIKVDHPHHIIMTGKEVVMMIQIIEVLRRQGMTR